MDKRLIAIAASAFMLTCAVTSANAQGTTTHSPVSRNRRQPRAAPG